MKPAPHILAASIRTALGLLPLATTPALPVMASPASSTDGSYPASALTVSYPVPAAAPYTVQYSVTPLEHDLRRYTQRSSMPVRVGEQEISYSEAAGQPVVRSGNPGFDALFTLAGLEMAQNSVSQIRDGSYNGGQPISCNCFETGASWHYVWTRDLSYAASLGLGMLDPRRVRNSLEFKLSGYRSGIAPASAVAGSSDGLQIIQDTGSGGSWPVSTDRVSWAFGADEALKALAPDERRAFARTALRALSNTLENDRLAAYDSSDGLYTGEQSFLDWREQSYAPWITSDLASMASSKALSTNAAHYKALTLAAQLAREQDQPALAQRYEDWAAALKRAINQHLWQADTGLYSSLTAGHFDGAALYKYDWLGQSLAIITGIADERQAASILAHYPHGPMGAPVIYPQQPDTAIYHNRAIWPFVTAFGLRAAAMAGNSAVADAAYQTLIRGAATNLSNMENMEWLSGLPMLKDQRDGKDLSGPVINSRRQLWSVGAYLGMVVGNVFGVQTTQHGIALQPFVTARLRREQFAGSDSISLRHLNLRGKQLQVTLRLPAASQSEGYYRVAGISLNGQPASASIDWAALADDNHIVITLGTLQAGQQKIQRVHAAPLAQDSAVTAPAEPQQVALARGSFGFPTLSFSAPPQGVRYNVYRNGRLAVQGLTSSSWADRRAPLLGQGAADNLCYSMEAVHQASGHRSHHTPLVCLHSGLEIAADDARFQSGISAEQGRIAGWGAGSDTLSVSGLRAERAGRYAVQLKYRNAAHHINLGISGGVKWMTLSDAAGRIVAQGVVQLPHNAAISWSTPLTAQLQAGSYRMQLGDFYNMSYLQSNSSYADAGGMQGPSNRFDLYGLRLLPLAATTTPNADHAANGGAAAAVAASDHSVTAGSTAVATAAAAQLPALPPRGSVQITAPIASPQLGNQRQLRIYLPPGYERDTAQRYPVLYMHDGQNLFDPASAAYGAAWEIAGVMDRLIANGEVAPVIIVGIDNNADRIAEYTPCCDARHGGGKLDAYLTFVADMVKPWVDAHLRTRPEREHTAIMGSSLGGIASVYMAQHRPDVFSMAASLSGSFWWNQQALVRQPPAHLPVRFYLDAGTSSDGLEDTEKMRDALLAQGYRAHTELEFYAAEAAIHNERSWAARVERPLRWLYPASPAHPVSSH
ncbi:alpha/beta hydrolase-fold protein [Duganella fentianensis]